MACDGRPGRKGALPAAYLRASKFVMLAKAPAWVHQNVIHARLPSSEEKAELIGRNMEFRKKAFMFDTSNVGAGMGAPSPEPASAELPCCCRKAW